MRAIGPILLGDSTMIDFVDDLAIKARVQHLMVTMYM
jgi:hypothetical protein